MSPHEIHISVIIPVHNKASTLSIMVEWIVSQLASNAFYEVIFVLDHCNDGSASILKLGANLSSVHIIENSEGAPSAARSRNIGIELSSGTHCLFLDADIIGSDAFAGRLREHISRRPNDVVLGEVLGNALSTQTWSLLVRDHVAIDHLNRSEMLQWARLQRELADIRKIFVSDREFGSFDTLPAPWTLGWSSAFAASSQKLREVGGFCELFNQKGSEDLELSYRLFRLGLSFSMLCQESVLHMPHDRDRVNEEQRDRDHEFKMLQMYPTAEMEALCSFDGFHANPMLSILARVDDALLRKVEALQFSIGGLQSLSLPNHIPLLIGTAPNFIIDAFDPQFIVRPCISPSCERLPLFGFRLPFEDMRFPHAVLMGVWQHLPERLMCRIFDEALRVAREVYVIKDTRLPLDMAMWPMESIYVHDTPYWERIHRVSRSLYDYSLSAIGEAQPLYTFHLRRLPISKTLKIMKNDHEDKQ